jgi:alanine dehydrogenase
MIDINQTQVEAHLPMNNCIDSMISLYANETESIYSQPRRSVSRIDSDSVILTMPGYSSKLHRFLVKVVTEYRKNPERFGKKVQGGKTLLFDSSDSELIAMIDSARLTAIRTGAVSGVATKLLARKDSHKAGMIGSGEQARTILEAVCCVRKITKAYVYSREYSHAKKFAHEMSLRVQLPIEPLHSLRELRERQVDILNVATSSSTPVLEWEDDVIEGMHINSIGTLPERQEMDIATIRNSRLFVDYKEGVLNEAGDVMNAIRHKEIKQDHIVGDLSDLLSQKKLGRINDADVTLFKSVGFALQDVYAAAKLYENTVRQ